MAFECAMSGVNALKAIVVPFDYEKARFYMQCVREFLRESEEFCLTHGRPLTTPFFDVTENDRVEIPPQIDSELENWLAAKGQYPPITKRVCRWYIKALVKADIGASLKRTTLYDALITLLQEGGDFYVHHGAVCIRDAGMIPFLRNGGALERGR